MHRLYFQRHGDRSQGLQGVVTWGYAHVCNSELLKSLKRFGRLQRPEKQTWEDFLALSPHLVSTRSSPR